MSCPAIASFFCGIVIVMLVCYAGILLEGNPNVLCVWLLGLENVCFSVELGFVLSFASYRVVSGKHPGFVLHRRKCKCLLFC